MLEKSYGPIIRVTISDAPQETKKTRCCCDLKLNKTGFRPFSDQFQDTSKTGSGINFFPTFLAAFFANFFWACFFEHAEQKTYYFEYAVQKSVAIF